MAYFYFDCIADASMFKTKYFVFIEFIVQNIVT